MPGRNRISAPRPATTSHSASKKRNPRTAAKSSSKSSAKPPQTPTSTTHSSFASGQKKRKSRAQDAYNIASYAAPDRTRIQQHRLGEVEGEEPRRKKQRLTGDDEDPDVPHGSGPRRLQRKGVLKGQRDDLDPHSNGVMEGDDESLGAESGTDEEFGKWRVGVGSEGEDSDVDSEEAFGSGDEERFEGFSFRGSKEKQFSGGIAKRRKMDEGGVSLNEDEVVEDGAGEGDEHEDGFGDEGVDLADVLDQSMSESGDDEQDDVRPSKPQKQQTEPQQQESFEADDTFASFGDEDAGSPADDEDDDSDMDDEDEAPSEYDEDENEDGIFDMSEDEDASTTNDADREQKLQALINSQSGASEQPQQSSDTAPPDRNALLARALSSLQSSSNLNPDLAASAQRLSRNLVPAGTTASSKKSQLVSAPLPKRQQDRIDRAAARQETNKTLDRWVDTVKHNRRADHLMFPLPDPSAQEPLGTNSLVSTANDKPRNELEAAIAGIMQQSGLGQSGGRAAEKKLMEYDELAENKLSLAEVQARRAELRRQRDLLFREEIKARRIKKIKSKAYRRVHRKDAAKQAEKERQLLVAAGIEGSDDEREANDRRRAEERMGQRHKSSKWAKGMKESGRAMWDAEAKDGVNEMARRGEDLRRKQEGKADDGSSVESDLSESEDADDGIEDRDEAGRLQRQLNKAQADGGGETSRLGQLKFMQRADAARRQRNDEDAQMLRKDLAGDSSDEDESDQSEPETSLGRKVFGPTSNNDQPNEPQTKPQRAEFEEGQSLDEEDGTMRSLQPEDEPQTTQSRQEPKTKETASTRPKLEPPASAKPFSAARSTTNGSMPNGKTKAEAPKGGDDQKHASKPQAHNTDGWTTIELHRDDDSSAKDRLAKQKPTDREDDDNAGSDAEPNVDAIEPSNWDLVQSAFGGDDVEKAFEAEKASAASSEDEKFEDNALPGWGSWTGEGISKKAQKRAEAKNKGRFVTKIAEGVKPEQRKDKNMDRVIVSEKRQKKNAKYLANQLPHPFESKIQYERGLRQPVGPEWTTKTTFQDATKPRVLTKPGKAIKPIEAPML